MLLLSCLFCYDQTGWDAWKLQHSVTRCHLNALQQIVKVSITFKKIGYMSKNLGAIIAQNELIIRFFIGYTESEPI